MRRRPSLATLLRWVPLAVVGPMLVFGSLYPLDLDLDLPRYQRNDVQRTADGVLRLGVPNRAITQGPAEWLPRAIAESDLRIEVEARAAIREQFGPARLLTVSESDVTRNVTLGQQGEDLVVRVLRPGSDSNGNPPLEAPGVFGDGAWHRIHVDIDAGAVEVNVDGRLVAREALASDPFASWDPTQRLALGDEVTGQRPWAGAVRVALVTAGDTTVDYLAPGALATPARSWYVPPRMRGFFDTLPLDDPLALVDHAAAFATLGAVTALALMRVRLSWGIAAVVGVALFVEAAQLVFAGRHALFFDLLANSTGGVLGVLATRPLWQRLARGLAGPAAIEGARSR